MAGQIRMTPEMMEQRASQYNQEADEFRGIKQSTTTMHNDFDSQSTARTQGLKSDEQKSDDSSKSLHNMHMKYNEETDARSKGLNTNLENAQNALKDITTLHSNYEAETTKRSQDFAANYHSFRASGKVLHQKHIPLSSTS